MYCQIRLALVGYLICVGSWASAQQRPDRYSTRNYQPGTSYICVQARSQRILKSMQQLVNSRGFSSQTVQLVQKNQESPIVKIGPIEYRRADSLIRQLRQLGIAATGEPTSPVACEYASDGSTNVGFDGFTGKKPDSMMPIFRPISAVPVSITSNFETTKGYLVAIPVNREELVQIAEQIIQSRQFGLRRENVQPRQAPIGPHVAIGTYVDYEPAKAMELLLRYGGYDARVYYRR